MGFFDSKKKTTNNNVTNDYTTNNVDNRITTNDVGDNSFSVSGDVDGALTINTSDYGAIENSGKISLAAFDFGADTAEGSFDLARDALATNESVLTSALDDVTDNSRYSLQQTAQTAEAMLSRVVNNNENGNVKTVQYITIGAAVLGAVYFFTNRNW